MIRFILILIFAISPARYTLAGEPSDTAAQAARVARLGTGIKGLSYHSVFAPKLSETVKGWRFENIETRGSTDNLDMLVAGEIDVALTQADVYASRVLEEPEVFGPLRVVGTIAEECVYIAGRSRGRISSLRGMAKRVGGRATILNVGPTATGMAESWNYISSMMPELADADLDYGNGVAALDRLVQGQLEAVGWVTTAANPDHPLMKIVRDDARLGFFEVNDGRLIDHQTDQLRVYEIKKVPILGACEEQLIQTVCTSSIIVVRPDVDPDLLYALAVALLDYEKRVVTERIDQGLPSL
jgi:TRAP-type uncharacterized transport system substrate-binding protein